MIQNKETSSNTLFDFIISEVINKDDSPYKQMMKKVNDIDIDYFEDIERDGEKICSELNMELKEIVVGRFKEMANELLTESDLENRLLSGIRLQIGNSNDNDICHKVLPTVVNALGKYADERLLFILEPKYDENELEKMYDNAKKITIIEHIMQNNKKDVIDFYHALMDRTEWECKALIEHRISLFLKQTAEKIALITTD